jgi:hypothetical protein
VDGLDVILGQKKKEEETTMNQGFWREQLKGWGRHQLPG